MILNNGDIYFMVALALHHMLPSEFAKIIGCRIIVDSYFHGSSEVNTSSSTFAAEQLDSSTDSPIFQHIATDCPENLHLCQACIFCHWSHHV